MKFYQVNNEVYQTEDQALERARALASLKRNETNIWILEGPETLIDEEGDFVVAESEIPTHCDQIDAIKVLP